MNLYLESQWRSFHHIYCLRRSAETLNIKIYGSRRPSYVKTILPEDITTRVYAQAYICLFNMNLDIPTLKLPENTELTTASRAVVEHLVVMEKIPKKYAPINPDLATRSTCQDLLQEAIKVVRKKFFKNRSSNLEDRLDSCEDNEKFKLLKCPLTKKIFRDPVIDNNGHTYEGKFIREHLEEPQAVSPMNRQEITYLAPNRILKDIILDKLQAQDSIPQDSIPNFTEFEKQDEDLAELYAQIAGACIDRKKYPEAFKSYTEMVKYTQNPELYERISLLYDTIEKPYDATLSRLYLASYQLKAGDVEAACRTLETVHNTVDVNVVEIVEALVKLYLHSKKFDEAILLLQQYSKADNDELKRRLTHLCHLVIAQRPAAYPLYNLLATWAEDHHNSQQILLKAACAAQQEKEYEIVLELYEKIDRDALLFIDQFVYLNTMELQGRNDEIIPWLYALARDYASRNMISEEIKACKQIAYRAPNSEIFARIIKGYRDLVMPDETPFNSTTNSTTVSEKISHWYRKWLSHLIDQKNWEEAEKVALEAKEQIENPHSINQLLEQIYDNYESYKLKELYFELIETCREQDQLEELERVCRLGSEHFGGYEFASTLADALRHQSKIPEAVMHYYKAFQEAMQYKGLNYVAVCVEKIKQIDSQMKFLEEGQRMHLLTQMSKLQEIVLPSTTFGSEKWMQFFNIVVDAIPPPKNIEKILKEQCPFTGKSVGETHILLLVPKFANTKHFTLNLLKELICNVNGFKTTCTVYTKQLETQIGPQSPDRPYWALIYPKIVEGTEGQSYEKQCAVLESKCSGQLYRLPSVLEAVTMVLTKYVESGEHLLGQDPCWMLTRCQETFGHQYTVGGFGDEGLNIGLAGNFCEVGSPGVTPVRLLEIASVV